MIVVNLFGGAGCGKSTLMALIFAELKKLGIETEMAPEWVKEKVWDESFKVMADQIYVFGKQLHRIKRLEDKVDVVICDSPLLCSIIYDQSKNQAFSNLVVDQFKSFNNMNYYLKRSTRYVPNGRMENEEEAKKKDEEIQVLLGVTGSRYQEVDKDEAIFVIVNQVLEALKKEEGD